MEHENIGTAEVEESGGASLVATVICCEVGGMFSCVVGEPSMGTSQSTPVKPEVDRSHVHVQWNPRIENTNGTAVN